MKKLLVLCAVVLLVGCADGTVTGPGMERNAADPDVPVASSPEPPGGIAPPSDGNSIPPHRGDDGDLTPPSR